MRGISLPRARHPGALRALMRSLPRGGKGLLLLLHQNADLDAVGSAIALKSLYPEAVIGAHQSVSLPARQLLESLDEEAEVDPSLEKYSYVLIVDTSNPSQVGLKDVPAIPHGVLDHHQETYSWRTPHVYVDPEASSTAEIVYHYYRLIGREIRRREAIALIAGIVGDTAKFRYAAPETILAVVHILNKSGVSMEEVLNTIEGEEYFNYSKKVAHLKAAQRLKFVAVGDQIVAISRVSSFESTAARVLLVAGADLAVVGNGGKQRKTGEVRISARAKPHIVNMGINLGEIMAELAPKYGLEGGGHPPAAGMNGRTDIPLGRILQDLLQDFVRRLKGIMNGVA